MKKIVFCGGGTAGHVMPNIALIEELKNEKVEIHYIGGNGIEKNILSKYPFVKYHEISCPKLIRKLTLRNLTIPFKLVKSIKDCKSLLNQIQPDVIFSKGGYISVPVVMASKKIPVIGHESDYSMGLANKIIYHYVDTMFFSFEDVAKKYKKGKFSGTPIRNNIYNGNALYIKNKLNISNSKPNILVVGGSSGAKAINDFILDNIKEITKEYNVIHITGKQKLKDNCYKEKCSLNNSNQYGYYHIEYVHDIENYFALADYVISRAGSNAIFELLSLNKLMILIPLPKDQSRGDQILNAKYFKSHNFAEVIEQKNLTLEELQNRLNILKSNKTKIITAMKESQTQNGTKIILDKIHKHLK